MLKFLTLLILLSTTLNCFAQVNKDGDFQLWTREVFDIPVTRKHRLELSFEQRTGDDAKELFFYYIQGQFFIPIDRVLTIAPSFRQSETNLSANRNWVGTSQPFLDFLITKKIALFSFLERARFACHIPEDQKNFVEYRNLVQITFNPLISKASPYIGDEIFIRQRRGLFQNRLTIGLELPFKKKINGRIYYLLRSEKSFDFIWNFQNILGLQLNYSF